MMLNQMPAPIASVGGNFIELEQITNVENAHAWMFMPDGETVESISQKYSQWTTFIVISLVGSTASMRFKLPNGWTTSEAYNIYQHYSSSRSTIGNGGSGSATFKVQPVHSDSQHDAFCIVSGESWKDGTIGLVV